MSPGLILWSLVQVSIFNIYPLSLKEPNPSCLIMFSQVNNHRFSLCWIWDFLWNVLCFSFWCSVPCPRVALGPKQWWPWTGWRENLGCWRTDLSFPTSRSACACNTRKHTLVSTYGERKEHAIKELWFYITREFAYSCPQINTHNDHLLIKPKAPLGGLNLTWEPGSSSLGDDRGSWLVEAKVFLLSDFADTSMTDCAACE